MSKHVAIQIIGVALIVGMSRGLFPPFFNGMNETLIAILGVAVI